MFDKCKEITKEEKCETIIEVWNDNAEEEFLKISKLIEKYNYVAMDTEFPGVVYNNYVSDIKVLENEYKILKINTDNLKLIQVGISISDQFGNRLEKNHTWQFNLKFNLLKEKDFQNPESINVLKEAGIDFDKLKEKGIEPLVFGELLTTSGLVYNSNINWIVFHGNYDFSYLIKNLINQFLPPNLEIFLKFLKQIFPNTVDIKILIQEFEKFRNHSLTKLGLDLKIKRIGISHQAGSDSMLTLFTFLELKENYFFNEIGLDKKNKIFGLSTDSLSMNYNYNEMISNNYNQMHLNYNQQLYGLYQNDINPDMNIMMNNYQRQMNQIGLMKNNRNLFSP